MNKTLKIYAPNLAIAIAAAAFFGYIIGVYVGGLPL